jgi:hypothetical protein
VRGRWEGVTFAGGKPRAKYFLAKGAERLCHGVMSAEQFSQCERDGGDREGNGVFHCEGLPRPFGGAWLRIGA